MQTATRPLTPSMSAPKTESLSVPTRQPSDFRQMTELAFKLSKEADARIVIYGEASREAIKKLQEHLRISEDAFPTKAELHPKNELQPEKAEMKDTDE